MKRPIRGAGRRFALCAAALLTAGTTVAAIGTAVTPAASAAVAHTTQAQTASAQTPSNTIKAVRIVNGKVRGEITCFGEVSKPHYLLPNHRSIVAAGTVICTSRVTSIAFALILTKDGRPVAKHGTVNFGKSRAIGFVTYRCAIDRTHRYRAHMAGVIVFPPGFSPPRQPFTLFGPSAQLRCRG
jgi:hypothetical protein